jgi:hypothetical protein
VSSYLYFSDDRPEKVDTSQCPRFDHRRYGLVGAPPYVGATDGLEARYASRDVVYLLGTSDTNPNHPALDKSCAGEAEDTYRLARGQSYFAYMKARHPHRFAQRVALVPSVAHDARRMFDSACGLAALFDRAGCPELSAP